MAYSYHIIIEDVTALVGDIDADKTAVIDAIRYVLQTQKGEDLLEGRSLRNWAFTHNYLRTTDSHAATGLAF
jgi:ABC-type branched-subunit amino acid transport system ATPase component